MKTKENNKQKNFTKLTRGGISLIVLVITIIVILILAAAVILTINNNNPVAEANKARYESDRANMQAVFTNVVAKVMAKNQGVVNIKTSQINTVTSGVKETTGEVNYTVVNAMNVENSRGKVVFGKGTNTETTYYTGKELPIYAAGETKWYVDEEGIISLEVAEVIYGSGEKPLDPGLYDENDVMIASWDVLVNDYGIDVKTDYATEDDLYNYLQNGTLPDTIQSGNYPGMLLQMNTDLASGTKLVVGEVEKIGAAAFVGNATLKEVELPNSINDIGLSAFCMCSSLEEINIPNKATSIEMIAFGECTALRSIEIPNSVTSIGDHAFIKCSGLTSVTIGNSVTSIGDSAFNECSSLASITIPDSVTSIGEAAFWGCSELTSVLIPDSVISIGESAFSECSGLTSVIIGNSITCIGNDTFFKCSSLTSIEIPDSVISIDSYAFGGCSSLTSVIIPDSVESIGECAFYECSSLTSIEIPNSVTSIDSYAFGGCSSLISIKVGENNTVYDSRDNCNSIIKTDANELIVGCKNSVIPNTVTSIGEDAFRGCSGLTSIEIPDSVISIDSYAFDSCTNLATIYYKGTATGAPWRAPKATVISEY